MKSRRLLFGIFILALILAISGCGKSAAQLTIDGQRFYEQKQYKEAIRCYTQALNRKPPVGDWSIQGSYDNLKWRIGVNYLLWSAEQRSSGNNTDADEKFQQAMQWCPSNGQQAMFDTAVQSVSEELMNTILKNAYSNKR